MSYFDRLFDKGWQKLEENKFLRAAACASVAIFLFLSPDADDRDLKICALYLAGTGFLWGAFYSLFPKIVSNIGAYILGGLLLILIIALGWFINPMLPSIGATPTAIIIGAIIIACAIVAKKN